MGHAWMIFRGLFQNGTTETCCSISIKPCCVLYDFDAATMWSNIALEDMFEASREFCLYDFGAKADILAS